MRRRWRWVVVAATTALLVVLPLLAHLLPGGDSSVSAATLLARIRSSASIDYSGYAVSQGGLALPVTDSDFYAIDQLFGGNNQLRVWWRGDDDWRVDTLGLTGESDLHSDAGGTWTWDYESNTARRITRSGAQLRLPRSDDLLPGNLARRLLSETPIGQVSRLPGRRVAGETTAGLRLTVNDKGTTVDHIDVWALPDSGLPVRVEVYGASHVPVVSTSFLDLTVEQPSSATTRFVPPVPASLRDGRFGDIVAAINTFGRSTPPADVAGLTRRGDLNLGAVGVYGRGVTVLVAVPLSPHLADDVLPQLRATPGAVENTKGLSAGVGPLNLQLSPPIGYGSRWLLVGTLTRSALVAAVATLPPVQGFGFGRR